MRKTTLFIAMSLDGYIADAQGGVAWLQGEQAGQDDMMTYHAFIKDIDTVIMGWNTYDQIRHELAVDEWAYKDLQSYVMTHREIKDEEGITFTSNDIRDLMDHLQHQDGKGIWICGGANLVHQLLEEDLIDCLHITIIPTLLGNGVLLFDTLKKERKLALIKTESYNGMVDVVYERRNEKGMCV